MAIPKMIARPKPRVTSPPIGASGKDRRTMVNDVAAARPSVWLISRSG
jgi:hypothetical protein